jgi:hypothetical protein
LASASPSAAAKVHHAKPAEPIADLPDVTDQRERRQHRGGGHDQHEDLASAGHRPRLYRVGAAEATPAGPPTSRA